MTPFIVQPLAGKCALVTGSTQGLGLAAATALAAAGCHIVLNGLADEATVAGLRRSLELHGVETAYDDADLRDPEQISRMIASASERFGLVDILINNAVVRHVAPIERFEPAHWDEALAVNLSSAFHTIRLALPVMKRAGWGRIVNVSSIYGSKGAVNRAAYVTTKTALIGLTRAVALEAAGTGVTCNAVCPGTSATTVHEQAVRELMSNGQTREEAERRVLTGKQPSGRFIAAEAVAQLILFVCGPSAADINGATLPIDGAWSAQ